jgi:TPR repeat protein
MAAQQGNAAAQINVGSLLANGMGVSVDYAQAVAWYTKAAEQGNPQGQTDAGFMLASGRGVSQDYKKAAEWFRKAAEQGYAPSRKTTSAICWRMAGELPRTPKQAVEWFRKAADQGYGLAQSSLGRGLRLWNGRRPEPLRRRSIGLTRLPAATRTTKPTPSGLTSTVALQAAVNPQALPQPAALPGSVAEPLLPNVAPLMFPLAASRPNPPPT